MKILIVSDYAVPVGGAEIVNLNLRAALREAGYDARLFSSSARPAGRRHDRHGSARETIADYECLGSTSRLRTLLQVANPWAARRLRQVLDEFRPDVVHVKLFLTQLSPLILPVLRNSPSLYHAVWYRAICPRGTKMLPDGVPCRVRAGTACYRLGCLPGRDWPPLMLQMRLWRRWRGVFRLIVANSATVQHSLMEEGFGPVEVVYNGVPVRPPRPPLTSPPTVVFAGRLVREKGADVLLRAFAQVTAEIPQARLLLAGEGPERSLLERMAASLGLAPHVLFTGHLPHEEMEHRFADAWVQVVPSRWAEPFGLVATEAMMRGIAVIASDSGGLAEIVRDGETGFLVPPGDEGVLARALVRVLNDRDLTERMGCAGREVALNRYKMPTFVAAMVEQYQRVVAGNGVAIG